ncbi:MAG: HAD family [Geobacteraceae bacterium]|nr:MAG: HAD family [Geobacteraceae bacterium]
MQGDIKSLVFDLDGTLYVNNGLGFAINLSACRYMADLKGIGIDEANMLIKETRERLSAKSGIDTPLSLACMEQGGDIKELHRGFAEDIQPERFLSRDERVVDLLKFLAGKFELYIYTNNNRSLSSRIMNAIGIAGLFRQVFTIETSWRPKPDRVTLEEILSEIGRKPSECLFVGDRYDIDLRLPAEMGCAVFLVNSVEELFPLCKLMNEENL